MSARFVVAGPSSGTNGGAWCVIDTWQGRPVAWWSSKNGAITEADALNEGVVMSDRFKSSPQTHRVFIALLLAVIVILVMVTASGVLG